MGEDRTGEVKARDPTRGYPRGAHTGSFSKTIKKEGRHQPGTANGLSMVTEQGQDGHSCSHCCVSLGMTCLNDKHNEGGMGASGARSPLHEFRVLLRGEALTDVQGDVGALTSVSCF